MKCLILGKMNSGKTTKAQILFKEYRKTSFKKCDVRVLVDNISSRDQWMMYGGIHAKYIHYGMDVSLLNEIITWGKSSDLDQKGEFHLIIDIDDFECYSDEVLGMIKEILECPSSLHVIITFSTEDNSLETCKKVQKLPFDKTFLFT